MVEALNHGRASKPPVAMLAPVPTLSQHCFVLVDIKQCLACQHIFRHITSVQRSVCASGNELHHVLLALTAHMVISYS